MNHLYPPFNDVRARGARCRSALSQADYMDAVVGDDDSLWKPLPEFLYPRHATVHRGRRRHPEGTAPYDAAKKLLAEAGYKGEKIVMLVATDMAITKAQGDVTADLLEAGSG